jgi:hypothetical protein
VQTYLGVGQKTGKIQTNIKMAEPKWVYFLYTALVWKDRPQRTAEHDEAGLLAAGLPDGIHGNWRVVSRMQPSVAREGRPRTARRLPPTTQASGQPPNPMVTQHRPWSGSSSGCNPARPHVVASPLSRSRFIPQISSV